MRELIGRILRLRCPSFGGMMIPSGRTRWCSKRRWHADSHAYEFERR